MLVDGGKPQAGPTVVAYLQQHGVTDIDLMVAAHGDADQHSPPTNLKWTGDYVWSNDGDEARPYDGEGRLVDAWSY